MWKTATHPDTGDKYQIEYPAPVVVRQAILELPCPPHGMMPKETAERLAEKLKLSEEQKNAVNPSGESIFWYMVAEGFSYLLQVGKLKQPGGPRTPYFLVDEPATPDQIELPAPAVVRQAILELRFPPDGMTIKNAVKILAYFFELSEEQKNAVTRRGNNIFYHIVALAFQFLKNEGKLKQPGGAGTPYFPVDEPATPDQIKLPAPAVVKQAILKLEFPTAGMTIKDAVEVLAGIFGLSEKQKNAGYKGGDNIFYHGVQTQFRNLLEEDKLKQPGGPRTPYFPVDEPATPDQIEGPAPAVVRQTITDPSRVSAKINEIAEKSADGYYIYRGESDSDPHDKVRSNLYREYEADIEAEQFDIAVVQAEILREAKKYTYKTDEFKILTELQHYGGKTNLIDFTTDYLVALFFACDGNRPEPGRVIFLQKQSEDYEVLPAPRTVSRAGAQKSVFVQSPSGVVEPDDVVDIPADLKGGILDHLQKHHNISPETIYNDLQGFIENRKTHKSAYTEFYKGITCQDRGHSEKDPAEKQAWDDKAIGHYTEAIDLKPELAIAYNNRGITYNDIGEVDRAIQDFNTAIDLKPDYATAYNNRGIAYRREGEVDKAIQDYNIAIDLNPQFAEAYNNRGAAYRREDEVDKAIQDFNTVIELKPELAEAYTNRGTVYRTIGDFETAIEDFSTAIDLKPEDADAYTNRGEAWLHLSEWENAQADLITAQNMGVDIVDSFHTAYESVADFEEQHGAKIPEDIKALLNPHFETVDTKPVVLTEGKTDARYILTALELFGEEELLNSLEIRPVGKQGKKGDKGGGQTGLDNYHKFYRLHSRSFKHATLLLYDSDVTKIPEPVEKLSVKRIQENPENTKVTKGIENLFPEELFEERFYDETVIKKEDGGQVTKLELNKPRFCDWICENGTSTDFAKFDSIVQILKEFVEAN